jgi:hypothetical protein
MNVQEMEFNLAYQVLYTGMEFASSPYQRENVLPIETLGLVILFQVDLQA